MKNPREFYLLFQDANFEKKNYTTVKQIGLRILLWKINPTSFDKPYAWLISSSLSTGFSAKKAVKNQPILNIKSLGNQGLVASSIGLGCMV